MRTTTRSLDLVVNKTIHFIARKVRKLQLLEMQVKEHSLNKNNQ